MRRLILRLAAPIVLVAAVIAPTLPAHADGPVEQIVPAERPADIRQDDYGIATVTKIYREVQDNYAGFDHRTQSVHMRMVSGPQSGEEFDMDNGILNAKDNMRVAVGDKLVIERIVKTDGSILYLTRDKYRLPSMLWLCAAFVLLSILFGGMRGFTSLLGLVVSIGILMTFVVPRIAAGDDPLTISIIGSYLIAFTSLYLAHGFNRRTTVALLSTCITLAFAAIISVLAVHAASLFGMGSEEALYLQSGPFAGINLQGLLIGGFIIGALGVLDDITTAQTAAVDEISKANPSLSSQALLQSGMSVGREHIASLINTLALAYVGASLPLFLLFRENADLPTWMVINGEFIAEEVIRTLVGSSALLLAVPISTWCAARFLRNRTGHIVKTGAVGYGHHH